MFKPSFANSVRLFPGQMILVDNIVNLTFGQIMKSDFTLCEIVHNGRIVDERAAVPIFSKVPPQVPALSFALKDGPHHWLMVQGWSYTLYKNETGEVLILDLQEPDHLAMFKLAWYGVM